jgi:hypothetical protein
MRRVLVEATRRRRRTSAAAGASVTLDGALDGMGGRGRRAGLDAALDALARLSAPGPDRGNRFFGGLDVKETAELWRVRTVLRDARRAWLAREPNVNSEKREKRKRLVLKQGDGPEALGGRADPVHRALEEPEECEKHSWLQPSERRFGGGGARTAAADSGASVLDRDLTDVADAVLRTASVRAQERLFGAWRLGGRWARGIRRDPPGAPGRPGQRGGHQDLRDAWLSRPGRSACRQRGRVGSPPSITRLFDANTLPDGTPWFVMEYMEDALTAIAARRSSVLGGSSSFVPCAAVLCHATR